MPKINEDVRGLFVELIKNNEWEPKQISYLTINPNFFRGHHYHKEGIEAFILLEGDCRLTTFNKEELKCGLETNLKQYELYTVLPGEEHTIFSKNGAKLIVLSSRGFNPEDPDVFTYE